MNTEALGCSGKRAVEGVKG